MTRRGGERALAWDLKKMHSQNGKKNFKGRSFCRQSEVLEVVVGSAIGAPVVGGKGGAGPQFALEGRGVDRPTPEDTPQRWGGSMVKNDRLYCTIGSGHARKDRKGWVV